MHMHPLNFEGFALKSLNTLFLPNLGLKLLGICQIPPPVKWPSKLLLSDSCDMHVSLIKNTKK